MRYNHCGGAPAEQSALASRAAVKNTSAMTRPRQGGRSVRNAGTFSGPKLEGSTWIPRPCSPPPVTTVLGTIPTIAPSF